MVHDFMRPPGFKMRFGATPHAVTVNVCNYQTSALTIGSVVILDLANMTDGGHVAVKTTTKVGDPLTFGVIAGTIPLSDGTTPTVGYATVYGQAKVAIKGATVNVAVGDALTTGDVAGYAYAGLIDGVKAVGTAIAASTVDAVLGTTAGYTWAFVDTGFAARKSGTSAAPITSAFASNFQQLYASSSAATGTIRANYTNLTLTGGAGGEAGRFFTTVSNAAPVDTCNGVHCSLSFGSSAGNITGLGTAGRFTLHANARSITGTTAAVMAEIYPEASGVVGGTMSLFKGRVSQVADGADGTAMASVDANAFFLDLTATAGEGNMVEAGSTLGTAYGGIKCKINGTTKYIPLYSAAPS